MINAFELMLGDYVNCTDKDGNVKPVIVDEIRNDLIRRQVDMYSDIDLSVYVYTKICGFELTMNGYKLRDFLFIPKDGLYYKEIKLEKQPKTLAQLQNIVRILSHELLVKFEN